MQKRIIHIIIFLSFLLEGYDALLAQDPHFSQYFSSPLTFNPAFTGYFDGTQRFGMNYRTQWANAGDSYTTGTASFETKVMTNTIGSSDKWGIGVLGLFDKSAGGIFKNSYVSFSTGFNKGLDAEGLQSIGIGIQATWARNNIDFNNLTFSNQFNGTGFDITIPSGETINNRTVNYVDLNAGILYNFQDESGTHFTFGAGMYHILKPKVSFFSGNNLTLAPRFSIHGSVSFAIGDGDNAFVSANGMQQGGASEYVLGAAYGKSIGETDNSLYVGAWIRFKDALFPYLGLRTPAYQIGLSYDITSRDISRQKNFNGSTEISFIYFMNSLNRKKGIPCFF